MPNITAAARPRQGNARPLPIAPADAGIVIRSPRRGENRTACPACAQVKARPGDDALAVRFEADGSWMAICHRCTWTAGSRGPRDWRPPPQRPQAAPEVDPAERLARALAVYARARPIEADTPAGRYLLGRRCALPPADGDLRWLPGERHPSHYTGPALVALVTDPTTAAPMTLHRTWLMADGSGKAAVDRPRLLWPGLSAKGGVCRLWPDEDLVTALGLGEGIETALTLGQVLWPVWATISAASMAALPLLPGVEALTIAVDHDAAGLAALNSLGPRWLEAGCELRTIVVPEYGADLNDLMRRLG